MLKRPLLSGQPGCSSILAHGLQQTLHARRLITYKASPAPPSNRRRLRRRFVLSTLASAGAVSLYYIANPPIRLAETDARDYSSTVKIQDTATHPRNYKLTVSDAESANKILRANETSNYLRPGSGRSGITSYHFNQVASNSPIEDDHIESHIEQRGTEWSFFGVFDGHSGWTTSDKLKKVLVPYVAESLSKTAEGSTAHAVSSAFVNLDRDIVYKSAEEALANRDLSKSAAVAQLMPAMSGSCALLATYNHAASQLHVAVTGDSRAIYTRRDKSGWSVKALSEDQTGSSASEAARLRAEHPGEADVVRNGRIKGGLEPSRAFGDARYKWSADVQAQINQRFYGRRANSSFQTPPYVIARPEITETQIDTAEQGFLVLGTDGLYEMLTNEEIATLVVGWRQKFDPAFSVKKSWIPAFLGGESSISNKIINEDEERSGQKSPHVKSRKQFVYQDENVATHIIRNALGGGDIDRLHGLLSLPYPLSRSYRDDISVTVVFFGPDADRRTEGVASEEQAKL